MIDLIGHILNKIIFNKEEETLSLTLDGDKKENDRVKHRTDGPCYHLFPKSDNSHVGGKNE